MVKKEINKKMSFGELLEENSDIAGVLMEKGMHCVGCPMSMRESLEEGALAHGLNPDELVKDIKKKIGKG